MQIHLDTDISVKVRLNVLSFCIAADVTQLLQEVLDIKYMFRQQSDTIATMMNMLNTVVQQINNPPPPPAAAPAAHQNGVRVMSPGDFILPVRDVQALDNLERVLALDHNKASLVS